MDLLVHVGLHKTGTTSVQDFLLRHREELLSHNILYPRSGLYGAQHAMFPGSLIPTHFHLDRVERKLDYGYYVSLLNEEARQYNPSLVVLSSEVFSEIISQRESCKALFDAIGKGFNTTRLLVTLRDSRQLALSALKHAVREKRKPWIDNPVGCYLDALGSTETVEKFWRDLGLPASFKYLEDAQSGLAQYYLGDILDEYSPNVSTLFQQSDHDTSDDGLGSRLNTDNLHASTYLLLFLIANHDRGFSLESKRIFALIGLASANNEKFEILKSNVKNSHLMKYLDYFNVNPGCKGAQASLSISLRDKVSALESAGLRSDGIGAALELMVEIKKLLD